VKSEHNTEKNTAAYITHRHGSRHCEIVIVQKQHFQLSQELLLLFADVATLLKVQSDL
jgi:hypothetical protein